MDGAHWIWVNCEDLALDGCSYEIYVRNAYEFNLEGNSFKLLWLFGDSQKFLDFKINLIIVFEHQVLKISTNNKSLKLKEQEKRIKIQYVKNRRDFPQIVQ